MTREEAIKELTELLPEEFLMEYSEAIRMAIKALKQEPFINKPCVSENVCEHDKQVVLDKIRAEIEQLKLHKAQFLTNDNKVCIDSREILEIIDKYRTEGSKE